MRTPFHRRCHGTAPQARRRVQWSLTPERPIRGVPLSVATTWASYSGLPEPYR